MQGTASRLALPRLGAALLGAIPGSVLRISRVGGAEVVVGAHGHPDATVAPCQHRAALSTALEGGCVRAYLYALGLFEGGPMQVSFESPPGTNVGGGVYGVDDLANRRLVFATTLCPATTREALRDASTYPVSVERARGGDGSDDVGSILAGARVAVGFDPLALVSIVRCTHPRHPTLEGVLEDAALAAAAACAVAELAA